MSYDTYFNIFDKSHVYFARFDTDIVTKSTIFALHIMSDVNASYQSKRYP